MSGLSASLTGRLEWGIMGRTGLKTGYKFGCIGQYGGLNSPIANTSDVFLFVFFAVSNTQRYDQTLSYPPVSPTILTGVTFLDFPQGLPGKKASTPVGVLFLPTSLGSSDRGVCEDRYIGDSPASEGCTLHRHRSKHGVPMTDV